MFRPKNIVSAAITALMLLSACSDAPAVDQSKSAHTENNGICIEVQPFARMPSSQVQYVVRELRKVCPNVVIRSDIGLPQAAFNAKRQRYRADSLIDYLKNIPGSGNIIVGLTNKDVSTTKGNISDWGVMGLGFCPGNACVISTFRLNKKNLLDQLFKVTIHEVGHTQGLQHCVVETCYMRDAEGGNPTDQETGFCETCRAALSEKGWVFN